MRLSVIVTSVVTFSSCVFAASNANINVLYRYDRSDEKHAIAAFDSTGQLIGYTCGNILDTGSFAKEHVSFTVDEQADGKISVGGTAYPIHSKVEYSGGPTCTRIYNHKMTELDCNVAMDENFVGIPVASNETEICFGRDLSSFDLRKGIRRINTANVDRLDRRSSVPWNGPDGFKKVGKRCLKELTTESDIPNPSQNYYEQQLSVNVYIYSLNRKNILLMTYM